MTLVRRSDRKGVRVYIDGEKLREKHFRGEALELFDKVVVRREGTPEDAEKLRKMWTEIGYAMGEIPEEEFKIEEVNVSEIERAPIFESIRCERCGELAMKTRIRYIDGKPFCLSCIGECDALVGRGIVQRFKIPFSRGEGYEEGFKQALKA